MFVDWWYQRLSPKNKWVFAEARMVIVDAGGVPVPGATVYGRWEGATTDSDSGVTDDAGWVRLRSDTVRNPPDGITFTFVVEDVDLNGWNYDQSANGDFNGDGDSGDTSNSITYP